ncbi:MAG: peptidoglycan editing factor PgeF [Nitrospinota bacterium]
MDGEIFLRHENEGIAWYSFVPLDKMGFFSHWITTRLGGLSKGAYASLNLGHHVDDEPSDVEKNREKVRNVFCGGKSIYTSKQVHGNGVLLVTPKIIKKYEADCLMVDEPDVPAAILTADCLPVILAAPSKKIAGVVHAGRKGIFLQTVPTAVAAMAMFSRADPSEITAAIGPGIRGCCYGVGNEIFTAGYQSFLKYKKSGNLDMPKAAYDQLVSAGVLPENIYDCGVCTSCNNGEFYSYRKEGGKTGRFMTGVYIKPLTV